MKDKVWIVFFKDTQAIWGVFSTRKKAYKALDAWGNKWTNDFYVLAYAVDYRGPKDAVRYASDTMDIVEHLYPDAFTLGRDNLPNTSSSGSSDI